VFDAFPSADGKAPATSGAVSLRKGGSYELTVYAYRRDGHAETIQLTAEGLPAGITCRPSVIGPGQTSAKLVLTAAADAAEQLAPIRIAGQSGAAESELRREAQVATLIHDALNGLPRTARLTESLVAGVMKDEQPFSILVDPISVDFSQDQQLLLPIRIARRIGFDGKVDLSLYGIPAEVDAPNVAIEPGKDSVLARIYVKEKAPASTSTILVQGTAAVPYRRNPWQADRAKVKATDADATVAAGQTAAAAADAGLKEAQQQVVTLTEQIRKLTEELAACTTQQQALLDEFTKAVAGQQSSLDALTKVQAQLPAVNATGTSTPDELNAALQSVADATAAADAAAKNLEIVNNSAGELAKQVGTAKDLEAAKLKEKTDSEVEMTKKIQAAEVTQAALTAAQKNVETAIAAKAAADEALKKAEEASKPNNVNVRAISDSLVLTIHPAPAKLTAAVPEAGAIKRGATAAVKVTLERRNSFAGVMKLTLVVPDGVTGVTADIVEVAADVNEGTLTITAAADAALGDLANVVIRATCDFGGRSASTDVPIAVKVTE